MWLVSAFRKCANNVFGGVIMSVVIKVFTILVISFVSTKFFHVLFEEIILAVAYRVGVVVYVMSHVIKETIPHLLILC